MKLKTTKIITARLVSVLEEQVNRFIDGRAADIQFTTLQQQEGRGDTAVYLLYNVAVITILE